MEKYRLMQPVCWISGFSLQQRLQFFLPTKVLLSQKYYSIQTSYELRIRIVFSAHQYRTFVVGG